MTAPFHPDILNPHLSLAGFKIMVDIDGVLARVSSYLSTLNALTGLNCQEQDIVYYGAVYDLYGRKTANLIFSTPNVVFNMEGHCDNIRQVREWARYFDIFLLTARPVSVRTATLAWLERYRLWQVIQGAYFEDKVAWAQANRPEVMIDDCAELLLEAHPYVRRTYLVNRPWNVGIAGSFLRINSLEEIII